VDYFHAPIWIFLIEEYRIRPFECPTNLDSIRRKKSGLWAGGRSSEGIMSSSMMTKHGVRELGDRPSCAATRRVVMWVGL
jgi:hypothetical protein